MSWDRYRRHHQGRALSLEMTRCVGVCGLAPVVMINDEVHGKLTAKSVPVLIGKIREAAAE